MYGVILYIIKYYNLYVLNIHSFLIISFLHILYAIYCKYFCKYLNQFFWYLVTFLHPRYSVYIYLCHDVYYDWLLSSRIYLFYLITIGRLYVYSYNLFFITFHVHIYAYLIIYDLFF